MKQQTKKLKSDKKLLFAAWSCENKNYGAYQMWYAPLKKIFKNIVFFDPQKYTKMYGQKGMNKKFLEFVKKEKPDYIFFWLILDEFLPDTLPKLRALSPKTKTINFFGDEDVRFDNYSLYQSLFIDYYFAFQQISPKVYKKYKIKNVFFNSATNLKNFKPLNLGKKYDVTFVGTAKNDRTEFVNYLKNNGINVRVFGAEWGHCPELRLIYGGRISDEKYVKVINQSKINLCFTKSWLGDTHLVGSFFEVGACKSFALVEQCPKFLELFKKDKEIVTFNSKEDLLKKVKYYLKNEQQREEIAKNTCKRISKDYDIDNQFKRIFTDIFKDEKNPPKNLPKLKKRAIRLSEKDLYLNPGELNKKLKDYDYVYFKKGWCKSSAHRIYLQMYSLMKLKKDISCCDYYLFSKGLGDYALLLSHMAVNLLNKKELSSVLDINQLMVTRTYFLKNINKFKEIFRNGKIDIVNKDNTAIITLPLIRIKNTNTIKNINSDAIQKTFRMGYISDIYTLVYKKKVLLDPLMYRFVLESLIGKQFLLKDFFKFTKARMNFKSLKQISRNLKGI